jgi:hypothetical protein
MVCWLLVDWCRDLARGTSIEYHCRGLGAHWAHISVSASSSLWMRSGAKRGAANSEIIEVAMDLIFGASPVGRPRLC